MVRSDDMVLSPRIDAKGDELNARGANRERQHSEAARKRNGLFGRLAKVQAVRTLRSARQNAARARRLQRAGGVRGVAAAGRAVAGGAARGAARAAVASPVGLMLSALAVAGVTALRLVTGEPLETTGEKVSEFFTGALDEEARASMETRQQFAGDSHLAGITGASGRVSSQVKRIFDDLQRGRETELRGASLFRRDAEFGVNSTLDILIVRAAQKIREAFGASGGPQAVARARSNLAALHAHEAGVQGPVPPASHAPR